MVDFGIGLMASNLGVTIEVFAMLIFLLPTLIFYAKDVQLGLMISFMTSMLIFMAFTGLDRSSSFGSYNTAMPLLVSLMLFVIMTFTLYGTRNTRSATNRGVI